MSTPSSRTPNYESTKSMAMTSLVPSTRAVSKDIPNAVSVGNGSMVMMSFIPIVVRSTNAAISVTAVPTIVSNSTTLITRPLRVISRKTTSSVLIKSVWTRSLWCSRPKWT